MGVGAVPLGWRFETIQNPLDRLHPNQSAKKSGHYHFGREKDVVLSEGFCRDIHPNGCSTRLLRRAYIRQYSRALIDWPVFLIFCFLASTVLTFGRPFQRTKREHRAFLCSALPDRKGTTIEEIYEVAFLIPTKPSKPEPKSRAAVGIGTGERRSGADVTPILTPPGFHVILKPSSSPIGTGVGVPTGPPLRETVITDPLGTLSS